MNRQTMLVVKLLSRLNNLHITLCIRMRYNTYVEFIRNQRLKAFLTFQKYKTSVRSYYISSSHGTLICRTDSLETWSWLNVFCSVDGDYSLVRVTGDGVGKQQTASSSHNRHLADGPTKEEH